jgi:hypothetical protein
MTDETKHSPLPFRVGKTSQRIITIFSSPGKSVCSIGSSHNPSPVKRLTDAKFIVKACNNYYKLNWEIKDLKARISCDNSRFEECREIQGELKQQNKELVEALERISRISRGFTEEDSFEELLGAYTTLAEIAEDELKKSKR